MPGRASSSSSRGTFGSSRRSTASYMAPRSVTHLSQAPAAAAATTTASPSFGQIIKEGFGWGLGNGIAQNLVRSFWPSSGGSATATTAATTTATTVATTSAAPVTTTPYTQCLERKKTEGYLNAEEVCLRETGLTQRN